MKLTTKYTMVCATGAFALICYGSFFNAINPQEFFTELYAGGTPMLNPMRMLEILGWGLAGACVAGFIGHQIGEILSNPKGISPEEKKKSRRKAAEEMLLRELEAAEAAGFPKMEDLEMGAATPPVAPTENN
jgi:hypothetical protein